MMEDTENRDFDWADDDDDVIVPGQPCIACYINPRGDVVLRQHGDGFHDDDSWIWFGVEHAPVVARAILQVAGCNLTVLPPVAPQSRTGPRDSTAAGRQRRYRERKKRESTPDVFDRDDHDVTERDTVTRDGQEA